MERRWIALTLIVWLGAAIWYLWDYWNAITWWALGDTDDNMRLAQVRAWLGGQGWYDLRQYRLDPPRGFDIHWSRIVDLPIAALIVLLRPVAGAAWAERIACGVAPLIPLSIVLVSMGAAVRRLVDPRAWPFAAGFVLTTSAAMLMFMPMRIDHHGWQLAMLTVTVAALADPAPVRGGALVGIASAVSLTIGLEMLPYAVMAGAIIALRWVWHREEAVRLQVYALTLGGASAAGFAGFASYANRVLRCDALTPVWLSVMVVAGALLFVIARLDARARWLRFALLVAAGAAIAAGFALVFPQCLGRPEQVSPELAQSWLNNVREAKPIYAHPLRVALPIAALPVVGIVGAGIATWRARRDDRLIGWAAVALFGTFAAAMLLWQSRAASAAQLMAVPGAVALAWWLVPRLLIHRSPLVRVGGTTLALVIASGLFAGLIVRSLKIDPPNGYARKINRATGDCVRTSRLVTLNRYPRQTIFTFVDLGPRLIVVTHHDAIAGPYHRNGDAILDVQHAFTGTPERARTIVARHRAGLLMICPDMSESTVYLSRARHGFYGRLVRGERFDWLSPLPLPATSPYRLFRVVRAR